MTHIGEYGERIMPQKHDEMTEEDKKALLRKIKRIFDESLDEEPIPPDDRPPSVRASLGVNGSGTF